MYITLGGHTHEDIDAAFGVIWSCISSDPCDTLQTYKDRIEKAFSMTVCMHKYLTFMLFLITKFFLNRASSKVSLFLLLCSKINN